MNGWPAKPELSVPEHPLVAQLYYQPIKREVATTSLVDIERLKQVVVTASIDGNALKLATALRDLQGHGIGATHESLTMAGGLTPLHLSVEANRPSTLAVLVDAGCDINARNRVGDTSAHIAARSNFVDCIRLLGSPQALADFSLEDAEGHKPEQVAACLGHTETVELIRHLVQTDVDVHMVKRRSDEVARQRKMVQLKERLFGRSFLSLEGGPEFEVPPRALLNDENTWAMRAGVRSFATVPVLLEKGVNKALSRVLAGNRAAAPGAAMAAVAAAAKLNHRHHHGRRRFQGLSPSESGEDGQSALTSMDVKESFLSSMDSSDDDGGMQGAGVSFEEREAKGLSAGGLQQAVQPPPHPQTATLSRLETVNTGSALACSRARVQARAAARAAGKIAAVRVCVLVAAGLPAGGSSDGGSSSRSGGGSSVFVELSFSEGGGLGLQAGSVGGACLSGGGGMEDQGRTVGFQTSLVPILDDDNARSRSSWGKSQGVVLEIDAKAAQEAATPASSAFDLVASVYCTNSSHAVTSTTPRECLGHVVLPATSFLLEPPAAAPVGGSWGPFIDDTDDGGGDSGDSSGCGGCGGGGGGGGGGDGRSEARLGWTVTAPLIPRAFGGSSELSEPKAAAERGDSALLTVGISVVSFSATLLSAEDEDERGRIGRDSGSENEDEEERREGSEDRRRYDDFSDDEEDDPRYFIPGRISESRWIDLSRGRPPDLGYSSCV